MEVFAPGELSTMDVEGGAAGEFVNVDREVGDGERVRCEVRRWFDVTPSTRFAPKTTQYALAGARELPYVGSAPAYCPTDTALQPDDQLVRFKPTKHAHRGPRGGADADVLFESQPLDLARGEQSELL